MILFWDIWKKNEGSKNMKNIGNVRYMWNTSIKELNSLGIPWGPESIGKRYNALKQDFQRILKCPDPLGDFPWIYLVICKGGGGKLVPVLVWMQDIYPSLYACRNQGNSDGKWYQYIGDYWKFIGGIMSIFVEIWIDKMLNIYPIYL